MSDRDLRAEPESSTELASSKRLRGLYRGEDPGDAPAEPPPIPDLGAYGLEVEGLLGKGGMGAVYRARQRHPARLVAVKVLSGGGLRDVELRERFEREIRALSSLTSPYIVQIYGAGSTPDGTPFYVMELVDGVPLEEYASQRRLSTTARLRLFTSICKGVQMAHRSAIIHRDLKPANVLVDRQGRPRILDLGLAKFQRRDAKEWATISRMSQVMGTPAFMAPEQFQADSDAVDTRADCYALGVILYRLVLAAHPYPIADGILATMRIVCTSEPVPPRDLEPRIPRDLAAVLLKALDKLPERRYQSPVELGDDIKRFLEGKPVQACLPTTWYRTRKFLARNRLATAISLGAFVLVALLTTVAVWRIAAARDRAQGALHAERIALEELDREAYLNSLPAIGQKLQDRDYVRAAEMLVRAPAGERSWEWQRLSYRAHPALLTLGVGQRLTSLGGISDRACITGDATGHITIWDLDEGKVHRTWRGHREEVRRVEVSLDGRLLLTSDRSEAKLWRADTLALVRTVPLPAVPTVSGPVPPCFGPYGWLMVPAADGIRLVDQGGAIRGTLPFRGKLAFCASSQQHETVAWSAAWGRGRADGSITVSRLERDGTLPANNWFKANYRAHGFAMSEDSVKVAVAGPSRIRMKDTESGSFPEVRRGYMENVLSFLPRSRTLLAGSARGLEMLSFRGEEPPQVEVLVRSCPRAAFALGDGAALLTLADEAIHVLPIRSGAPPLLRGPAAGRTWRLAPDGGLLAVAGERLSIYEIGSGRCVHDLGRESPPATMLSFSPDGKTLAAATSGRRQIRLHSLSSGSLSPVVPCPQPVIAITQGVAGQLAAIGTGASLYFHEPDQDRWVARAAGFRMRLAPAVLRFSPTGQRLVVGTEGGGAILLDPRDGTVQKEFEPADFQAAAFGPNGRWLLLASLDTGLLWDCATGQVHGRLQPFGAVPGKRMVRFSPDGRRVVVGENRAVSVWDVLSCRQLTQEPLALDTAAEGAFGPDDSLVVVGPNGSVASLACLPTTQGSSSSLVQGRLCAWRRYRAARTIPVSPRPSSQSPLVCFLGTSATAIPGTAGAHAEELAYWREHGARTVLLDGTDLPDQDALARVDVLRLVGAGDSPLPEASVGRVRRWLEQGGRLFVSGTSPHIGALLVALGLPRPGQVQTVRIPADLPGALPVRSPTGAYRLLHAVRHRLAGGPRGGGPVLRAQVGKGMVLAVLADRWDADAPDAADVTRCHVARGDNRLILRDCVRCLMSRPSFGEEGASH